MAHRAPRAADAPAAADHDGRRQRAQPLHLSAAAARRIALAAQGFDRPRPARPPGARQIASLIRRLGLLQLDSVNVFCRSHYLPVFARLGPYEQAILDRLAGHDGSRASTTQPSTQPGHARKRPTIRAFTEYWAHEASLIPAELLPLLRWRMAGVDEYAWGSMVRIWRDRPELVEATLALVAREGPIRAGATGGERTQRSPGQMWNWHDGKRALERLFFTGQVAAAGRAAFERLYDLPERVLPAEVLAAPTPAPEDAQRELVRIAAAALGVATEPDLGDYFRLPRAASKARVSELVQAGELLPASVDGWSAPAYAWPGARRPRRIAARALLSPFDSLIWHRPRTERLFDFSYRIEIYTPAHKRIHGYYVLPFLLGDRLVARVDLKSDRQSGVLRVRGAFAEPAVAGDHAERRPVPGASGTRESFGRAPIARELAAELWLTATWLGLGDVKVEQRGDLAQALRASV